MHNLFLGISLPTLALYTLMLASTAHASDITLAVANSTCTTIKAVGERFSQTHDIKINYICKSSGLLAKGVRGGAIQADIYISANKRWMDYMIQGGFVAADKVISPWGNHLLVGAPANSPLKFDEWNDLTSDNVKSILIGDPSTAPFGRYAKQAMQKTGIWERVKQKITTKKHITLLAETLAQADNNTVGILFSTNLTDQVRPLYSIDPTWHPAIRYYMAPIEQSAGQSAAAELLNYIRSDPGIEIFKTAGFDVNPQ